MSIAVAILPNNSPLDHPTLAGETPTRLLKQAAARLTLEPGSLLIFGQFSSLPDWETANVQRILLLRQDMPLISTETMQNLLEDKSDSPLVIVRAPGHPTLAACADVSWLEENFRTPIPPTILDSLISFDPARIPPFNPSECQVVNSQVGLAKAKQILRQRINRGWMNAGVLIEDPATTYIDAAVTIGAGTNLLPNTHLWGKTIIGKDSLIGPNSMVRDSQIGDRCRVTASMVEQAMMEDESDIGPFSHLRKGAHLCRGSHMGNFGEIKNSTLGPNAKMGHFSYLGDATVGEDVNIGAGTITCNYDGEKKHKTVIDKGAFIGSDTMLVAPLHIGVGARIGAGSVVTHDVPDGAVAYGVPARVKNPDKEKGEEGEPSGPSK
jgi:bifunctional N-acetylglucosamine-1-phosphate-uridyltransferase/glucosamine-1-phosphate-acetyltransferase GlmU-like protein